MAPRSTAVSSRAWARRRLGACASIASCSAEGATAPPGAFDGSADYYVTLFQEMAHSTGHRSRLARPLGLAASVDFGAEDYGREELVAEVGAAMLAGVAGVEQPVLAASAAYVAGWITALRGDPRLAVAAAGAAQRAADFVLGTSEEQPAPESRPTRTA